MKAMTASVPEFELLGLGSQLVGGLAAFGVVLLLVFHEVGHQDPAVGPNFTERDAPLFQEFDQIGTLALLISVSALSGAPR